MKTTRALFAFLFLTGSFSTYAATTQRTAQMNVNEFAILSSFLNFENENCQIGSDFNLEHPQAEYRFLILNNGEQQILPVKATDSFTYTESSDLQNTVTGFGLEIKILNGNVKKITYDGKSCP